MKTKTLLCIGFVSGLATLTPLTWPGASAAVDPSKQGQDVPWLSEVVAPPKTLP